MMAKSKPQKMREKLVREGRLNPEIMRGSWNGVDPLTKKAPTIVELKERKHNKHKSRWNGGKDADHSIYCVNR